MGAPATFHLADLWEAVLPEVADRTALRCGEASRTYAELDDRADRLARWMAARGVGPGQHVGVHLLNGIEYLEAMLAAWKLRAVPINVNTRYTSTELGHLLVDADLVGIVHQRGFAPRLAAIRDQTPSLGWYLSVSDPPTSSPGLDAEPAEVAAAHEALGSVDLEEALGTDEAGDVSLGATGTWPPRSGDDPYVIYTGGTTGAPKGVVWRQEDAFFSCIGGGDPMRLQGPVDTPAQVLERIVGGPFVFLAVAPLMHAAGQWTAVSWLLAGGTVVLTPGSFDPARVWEAIGKHGVNVMALVGDAMVRPLLDEWDRAGGYDVRTLVSIGSGGAPLSPVLRDRLIDRLPDVGVVDGFGSSETGAQGSQRLGAGAGSGGVTVFTPYGDQTTVLDPTTRRPVAPGSGEVGRVALRGRIPQGYYGDPERTAETFVEVDGHRWVVTGDVATVEEDGRITLLGRGSGVINTGGEKVYGEEVEAVLKAHPSVYDVIVVGVPDERWGSAVAAVVQPVDGERPTLEELADHARTQLAGYKVPRHLVVVEEVQRTPAGKPDHRWARTAAGAATRSGADVGGDVGDSAGG